MRTLRVLVVDDSALNRRTLSELLRSFPGVEVAGSAADGEQALRLADELKPDLITLDLEMPRMDGFTFLRLLLASRPLPVIVISSHSAKDKVFRALELGAIDFIAKPPASGGPDASVLPGAGVIRAQLEPMIDMVRQLTPAKLQRRLNVPAGSFAPSVRPPAQVAAPSPIIAVAASTGGPSALMELFAGLPELGAAAIVVAQHMPERFTRTFAERLDKQGSFRVIEAEHGSELLPHSAFICPGGRCVELERRGQRIIARVVHPAVDDRYAPSADRLFRSVARLAGRKAIGVVLTGMGEDAAKGVVALKEAGGYVLAETEESAVVYGMPRAAVQTGCVDELLPLAGIVSRVRQLVSS